MPNPQEEKTSVNHSPSLFLFLPPSLPPSLLSVIRVYVHVSISLRGSKPCVVCVRSPRVFHMQISHISLSTQAFTWTSYSLQLLDKTHLSGIVGRPATSSIMRAQCSMAAVAVDSADGWRLLLIRLQSKGRCASLVERDLCLLSFSFV